jgi:hypothetical protein
MLIFMFAFSKLNITKLDNKSDFNISIYKQRK